MSLSTYDMGFFQPNELSQKKLSPGRYSLSSQSNCPYVSLVGASGYTKRFSWGEIVEVPMGQLVSVRNDSYHAGDIIINGGCDYFNRPARITVPVPMRLVTIIDGGEEETFWQPDYPADVRLARRAYFVGNWATNALATSSITIVGKAFERSHNTGNELSSLEQGAGYQKFETYPAAFAPGPIALGPQTSFSGVYVGDDSRPHALLTIAQVYISDNIQIQNLVNPGVFNAYWLMEY
jgi:hypothetical protein